MTLNGETMLFRLRGFLLMLAWVWVGAVKNYRELRLKRVDRRAAAASWRMSMVTIKAWFRLRRQGF